VKWRKWFVLVFIIATGTHALLLFATPYVMMAGLNYLIGKEVGFGNLMLSEQPEHGKDKVVRSSPDLLYSFCAFRLKDGPLRVQAPASPGYMSVSFFGHNTDNFLSINDSQAPSGFDVVLAKRGASVALPANARLLETDSPFGVILFRYYLASKLSSDLDSLRQAASCELLAN
jgi:uncharacterized membrane protein